MNRRAILKAGLALPVAGLAVPAAGLFSSPVRAAYPTKPISFVIGYTAGGNVDNFARALGNEVASLLGQPVVVENRPGANEMLATQTISRAAPDGYNILIVTEAPITQSQFLYKQINYDPNELTPISLLVRVPLVLVARPDYPVNTLKEFIAHAKSNGLIGGSAGVGGVTHLPMAMLANTQGIPFTHVPYKGSSAMFPDLMTGRIDACFTGSSAAITHIKSGGVKGIAVGSPERLDALPDVETFTENGLDNVGSSYTISAYGPKGMSAEARENLAKAFNTVLADPAFKEKALAPSGYLVDGTSGADFAAYLEKDRVIQKERVRISGAQLN